MGIDRTFYVGPMVKCEMYEDKKTIKIKICPNGRQISKDKYCKDCGSKIVVIDNSEKSFHPNEYEIMTLVKDKLIKVQVDTPSVYWYPNVRWSGDLNIEVGKYDRLEPFEFDGMMIENALRDFRKAFSKELKILDKKYRGEARVIWAAASWSW